MSPDGFLGLVVLRRDWPLRLRRKITCACPVSFRWLRLSVADRDLASQDFSLLRLRGMQLWMPSARPARARFAPKREQAQRRALFSRCARSAARHAGTEAGW